MPCLASTATSCAGTPRLAKVRGWVVGAELEAETGMSSVDRADKRWSPGIGGGRVSKAPHPWKPFRSPSDERPARPHGVAFTARSAHPQSTARAAGDVGPTPGPVLRPKFMGCYAAFRG